MGRFAAGRFCDAEFLFYQAAKRRAVEVLVVVVGLPVRSQDKPVMGDLFLARLFRDHFAFFSTGHNGP